MHKHLNIWCVSSKIASLNLLEFIQRLGSYVTMVQNILAQVFALYPYLPPWSLSFPFYHPFYLPHISFHLCPSHWLYSSILLFLSDSLVSFSSLPFISPIYQLLGLTCWVPPKLCVLLRMSNVCFQCPDFYLLFLSNNGCHTSLSRLSWIGFHYSTINTALLSVDFVNALDNVSWQRHMIYFCMYLWKTSFQSIRLEWPPSVKPIATFTNSNFFS